MGFEPGRVPGRFDMLQASGEFISGAGDQVPGRSADPGRLAGQPSLGGAASTTRNPLCPLPGMAWTRLNPASTDSNSAR